MAYLRNSTINRVNLHYGISAFAQGAGGIFLLVFLLRAGVSVTSTLLALAAILAGRFILRPVVLPLAKRFGLRPMVIVGSLALGVQYLVLAEVQGVGIALFALCFVASLGDVFYWTTYHAYFSTLGDSEHRGHQIGAREALAAVVGIVAPLVGAFALEVLGPRPAFAGVGFVQALSALPLVRAPNIAIKAAAPGAFRAARLGVALFAFDGWFAASYYLVWQVALFVTLGESFSAYGGAMALAALVGAAAGLLLGRQIDAGRGQRAVAVAFAVATGVVVMRAASLGSLELAIAANALGALVACLLVPAMMTPVYNLAKTSPCPLRFHIAAEGGWDVGCFTASLMAAALSAAGVSLSVAILLALPPVTAIAVLLRGYYARNPVAIDMRVAPIAAEPLP
jgi:hypothetical protein